MKVLGPNEVKSFLTTCQGERLEALYVVAIGLRLRSGEVLGLRWDAVDLENGRLRVVQALQYQRDGPSTGPRSWSSPSRSARGGRWTCRRRWPRLYDSRGGGRQRSGSRLAPSGGRSGVWSFAPIAASR